MNAFFPIQSMPIAITSLANGDVVGAWDHNETIRVYRSPLDLSENLPYLTIDNPTINSIYQIFAHPWRSLVVDTSGFGYDTEIGRIAFQYSLPMNLFPLEHSIAVTEESFAAILRTSRELTPRSLRIWDWEGYQVLETYLPAPAGYDQPWIPVTITTKGRDFYILGEHPVIPGSYQSFLLSAKNGVEVNKPSAFLNPFSWQGWRGLGPLGPMQTSNDPWLYNAGGDWIFAPSDRNGYWVNTSIGYQWITPDFPQYQYSSKLGWILYQGIEADRKTWHSFSFRRTFNDSEQYLPDSDDIPPIAIYNNEGVHLETWAYANENTFFIHLVSAGGILPVETEKQVYPQSNEVHYTIRHRSDNIEVDGYYQFHYTSPTDGIVEGEVKARVKTAPRRWTTETSTDIGRFAWVPYPEAARW